MSSTRRLRLLVFALALATSACLVAIASHDTNAYFTSVRAGMMGGTLGSSPAQRPFGLEPGTSKARHWGAKDSQPARVLPIAQIDPGGAMFLDFGDETARNGNASPDVLRLVSLVAEPRAVSFTVSGAIAVLVTEVRLKDGTSILQGGATASVYVKIDVPGDADPGDYSGTLTVHVDGWSVDPMLPMTITVRGTPPAATPAASPTPAPAATPGEDPSATPSGSPSAAPSADPTTTPSPTAPATPVATPVALSSPASYHDPAGGAHV